MAKGSAESDSLEIETWSFSGTDSRGQPYIFPGEEDGPITDNPWRGTVVIGGTVTVRASVNGGNPQSHTGVFLREYQRLAGSRVEDLVVRNDELGPFLDMYTERLNVVMREADEASDNLVDGTYPVRFGCTFDW